MRAVVGRDHERLRVIAPDVGDLYMWTRDYGTYGDVELVMPPGPPAEWSIETVDVVDGNKSVDVEMWTKQEGRSDLALQAGATRGRSRRVGAADPEPACHVNSERRLPVGAPTICCIG